MYTYVRIYILLKYRLETVAGAHVSDGHCDEGLWQKSFCVYSNKIKHLNVHTTSKI